MSILGDRIRALRESKTLHQIEFAKEIGISNVAISRYESGERKPDYETLQQIADFFEVTLDYLFGRTNVPEAFQKVLISDMEVTFSIDELKLFAELKRYPGLLNELTSNPEMKVKELIKLHKIKNVILEEEMDYGSSFNIVKAPFN